eukprot:CAMPEP_0180222514 /NCGR_PEP_ID=MMETSP0987-20121128/20787_1 /TAXON_ID=697907 /ORGANISM="non described non described, Strain CCMP2293" /LENGTH=47 /DNA_ID= /DNA_START= /DNA_END= /DNA_ORIENTATION=
MSSDVSTSSLVSQRSPSAGSQRTSSESSCSAVIFDTSSNAAEVVGPP